PRTGRPRSGAPSSPHPHPHPHPATPRPQRHPAPAPPRTRTAPRPHRPAPAPPRARTAPRPPGPTAPHRHPPVYRVRITSPAGVRPAVGAGIPLWAAGVRGGLLYGSRMDLRKIRLPARARGGGRRRRWAAAAAAVFVLAGAGTWTAVASEDPPA